MKFMKSKPVRFKVGDSVVVKPGIQDEDFDIDIGGWQGRIIEITADEMLNVEWDSVTLRQMPPAYIENSEEEGLVWGQYYLAPDDVEPVPARDKHTDVGQVSSELFAQHSWVSLGDEGRRIQAVLAKVSPRDEWGAFEAWQEALSNTLQVPFEAEISEPQRGPLRQGDRVIVKDIDDVVDLYGILAAVKHAKGRYQIPLCDLEVTDPKSPNYLPVKDYAVWFANR